MNSAELIKNLRDEADLCRNETATDIADLLDDAASALIATGALFSALKDERNALAARVRELEADIEKAERRAERLERHAEAMAAAIERSMGYVNAAKAYRADKGE